MSQAPGTGQQLVRNTLYTGLGRGASLIVGFCLSPYILNTLGTRAFGFWVLAFAVGYHLSIILHFGSSLGLIYKIAEFRAKGDEQAVYRSLGAYIILSLISFILTVLAFLALTPLIAPWLGLENNFLWNGEERFGLELIVCAAASTFARPLTLAWELILQGCERFDWSGKMAIMRAIGWAAIVILLLQNNFGARALLLGEAFLLCLLAVPGSIMAWRALPGSGWKIRWPSWEEFKSQGRYGLGVYVSLVTDLLNSHSDKLVLGGQLSSVHVKAYELGQKITLPGRLALSMIGQVVVPSVPSVLAKMGQDGLEKLHRIGQKGMILCSALFFGFLICAAPTFLKTWLGPGAVDDLTILALRCLGLSSFLALHSEVSVQMARGLGRLRTEIRATLIFSIIGFILRFLCLYFWDLQGLLWGTVGTSLISSGYLLFAFAGILNYSPWSHIRDCSLKPIFIAVVAGLSVLVLDSFLTIPQSYSFFGRRTPYLLTLTCEALCFGASAAVCGVLLGIIDDDMKTVARQFRSILARMGGKT
ncbi:MAG: lipopolysaccharide biosynthesis protein [Planctomycetota bacterium]|nr:lipopolysaccharide biosynthesis protein [Planctomycetota bacterium]